MTSAAGLGDPVASFPKVTNSHSSPRISPLQIRAPAASQRDQPWQSQEPHSVLGWSETAEGGWVFTEPVAGGSSVSPSIAPNPRSPCGSWVPRGAQA